jgi:DNA-binding response OmpR family regulator
VSHGEISQTAESAGAQARGLTNPSRRILVVDDDAKICQLNAEVLSRSGYQTETAEDGAAAWEALQANGYDLLITDHDMPKVSGVELVKKVRSAQMTLPVILATGSMPEEELNRHPWLQLAATLLKPFTGDELLGAVKKVLRPTGGEGEQLESLPSWRGRPSAHVLSRG